MLFGAVPYHGSELGLGDKASGCKGLDNSLHLFPCLPLLPVVVDIVPCFASVCAVASSINHLLFQAYVGISAWPSIFANRACAKAMVLFSILF